MAVQLDHLMVPARDKLASAKMLAGILGIPWPETGVGPFAPVFVNDGLTLDFDAWSEPDGHYWEMLTESYARRP